MEKNDLSFFMRAGDFARIVREIFMGTSVLNLLTVLFTKHLSGSSKLT